MTRALGAEELAEAVAILRMGGLVAFPTETVYGLGADASNDDAIAKVYEAKGRPTGHPLIVHLASASQLAEWSASSDERVTQLAAAFWPGPLTLIVPRSDRVSLAVTGGRETVGLRVPAHDLTRSLLTLFDGGLVGPSANRFGHVSPTTAAHVMADLDGRIDAVLDGGSADVGIESTIVEIIDDGPVVLLRPGAIAVGQLEHVLGEVVSDGRTGDSRAAGMLASHYAPSAPVRVIQSLAGLVLNPQTVLIAHDDSAVPGGGAEQQKNLIWMERLPADAGGFARGLYAALRSADSHNPSEILVLPPTSGAMLDAILDRLAKAAAAR